MPLEDILQEVEKRKEEEIRKITEEYKARIESVSSQVDTDIKELESYYTRKTEDDSKALREREIKLAEMEAKGLEREKISQLMHSAFERADFFLRNISDTKEYPAILKKMVGLGAETLGENCIIHARKEDLSFLQDLNSVKIAKGNIKEAGIIAESSDHTRELDLRISTLMNDLRERISLAFMEYMGEE